MLYMQIGAVATYYLQDGLGSTTALTDGGGNLLERYTYDAFGTPSVFDPNGNPLAASAYANRFLFTGREFLQETGLYDYRNRAYSAALGRFMQVDPIRFDAGDVNLYRYVGNNSTDMVDPTGFVEFRSFHEFHWHGNWGGPGWSNGGWHPESGFIPAKDDPRYKGDTDEEDACYEGHDRCIHDCPTCPAHGNTCVRKCDKALHKCLNGMKNKTIGSRFTSAMFGGPIPWLVH
jgi:RHS repeat-associated protein